MYTGNSDVPDDVFSDVLKQISVFVRTKVMPRELEIMATDAIPADLRARAADMGLFGYAIPQEWGGLGLDLVQDAEVAMELGYTSLALRSMFGTRERRKALVVSNSRPTRVTRVPAGHAGPAQSTASSSSTSVSSSSELMPEV